jgi:hypothetical protein
MSPGAAEAAVWVSPTTLVAMINLPVPADGIT